MANPAPAAKPAGWASFLGGALTSLGLEDVAKVVERDLGEFIGTVATDTERAAEQALKALEGGAEGVEAGAQASAGPGVGAQAPTALAASAGGGSAGGAGSGSAGSSAGSGSSSHSSSLSPPDEWVYVGGDSMPILASSSGAGEGSGAAAAAAAAAAEGAAAAAGMRASAGSPEAAGAGAGAGAGAAPMSAIQKLQARLESGEEEEDAGGWGDATSEDEADKK